MKKILFIFSLFISTVAFAQVPLAGYVTTIGQSDTYPVTLDSLQAGGYTTTYNYTTRNAIPAARRKIGMQVRYSSNTDSTFVLRGGIANSNWVYINTSLNVKDSTTVSNYINAAAWGDSFTQGFNDTTWVNYFNRRSGLNTYKGGIGGNTSAQIKNRFLSNPSLWPYITIIEAGRNDLALTYAQDTILNNIAAMVANIPHNRYVVVSIFNSGTEPSGSATYIKIAAINAALASTYGSHYVDARAYIVSKYNPSLPTDVTAHAADEPPPSLRRDNLHLNYLGDS